MTEKEYGNLKEGDIVREKLSGLAYIVTAKYGGYIIAVRTVSIMSPADWDLVCDDPIGRKSFAYNLLLKNWRSHF